MLQSSARNSSMPGELDRKSTHVSIPVVKDEDKLQRVITRSQTGSSGSEESEIIFPEGTVPVDVHVYKGEIIEEKYGEVDDSELNQVVYKVVPVYHTNTKEIIKKEQVVTQHVVKKPVHNYVDTYVDKEIIREVEIIEEVPVKKQITRQVPKITYEDKIVSKKRFIPVEETVEVEKRVEVPGEIIETTRTVPVEKIVYRDTYQDVNKPVVVSQVVKPCLTDSGDLLEVKAKVLTPNITTAVAMIPKPVDLELHLDSVRTKYKAAYLTDKQFNSTLAEMNKDASDKVKASLPYRKTIHGSIEFEDLCPSFTYLPKGFVKVGNSYRLATAANSCSSSKSSEYRTVRDAKLLTVRNQKKSANVSAASSVVSKSVVASQQGRSVITQTDTVVSKRTYDSKKSAGHKKNGERVRRRVRRVKKNHSAISV